MTKPAAADPAAAAAPVEPADALRGASPTLRPAEVRSAQGSDVEVVIDGVAARD